jgi:F0F1-type ATP synthase membrane subunit a
VIFYFILAGLAVILFNYCFKYRNIISNNWTLLSESFFRTILLMIETFSGLKYTIYLPLFYTIFHLILFSNLLGLIPYSTTPTVELIITLSIAFTLLVGIFFIGFLTHKFFLFSFFLPSKTPLALIPIKVLLETIAFFFRIFS